MKHSLKIFTICALTSLTTSGCGKDDGPNMEGTLQEIPGLPAPPASAQGMTNKPVFNDAGELLDPTADSDGDGVTDGDEIRPATITIDPYGFALLAVNTQAYAERLVTVEVTSDPRFADTDGDGINDGEERSAKSHPRLVDTDGDGLTDQEEIANFGTSPTSVDSDGDARGGDPDNLRPALFSLFDGGELKLTGGANGSRVPGFDATSPIESDTDGDGYNDYDETISPLKSPVIADLPAMRVIPTPSSTIDLYLKTTTSEGQSSSSTFGESIELDKESEIVIGTETAFSVETSTSLTQYLDETVTVGCCNDIVSTDIEVGTKAEGKITNESSFGMSFETSEAQELRKAAQEANAATIEQGLTIDGGVIRLSVDIRNDGQRSVNIDGIVVSLSSVSRETNLRRPVGELTAEAMGLSLAPGDQVTINLSNNDIPTTAMMELMENPTNLAISGARYNLSDESGLDFDFVEADVLQRTSLVAVDFGDGRIVEQYIASNITPFDQDGGPRGRSIGEAIELMGIPFEYVQNPDNPDVNFVDIDGYVTEFHPNPPSPLGDPLPYEHSGGPNGRLVKKGWFAVVNRRERALARDEFFANLFDAPIYPGDVVTLIYNEDNDQDGLSAFEEARYGSLDTTPDSDGDGLSDFFEVREGWLLRRPGQRTARTFSSPGAQDADEDGLLDVEEAPVGDWPGSDPYNSDTDNDGLSDALEKAAEAYNFDPSTPGGPPPRQVSCDIAARPDCYVLTSATSFDTLAMLPCSRFDTRFNEFIVSYGDQDFYYATLTPEEAAKTRRSDLSLANTNSIASAQMTMGGDAQYNGLKAYVPASLIEWDNSGDPFGSPPSATCNIWIPKNFSSQNVDGQNFFLLENWDRIACDSLRVGAPSFVAKVTDEQYRFPGEWLELNLRTTITDNEGDMISVDVLYPDFGITQFDFEPTGEWSQEIPFWGSSESATLVVHDTFGFETTHQCSWFGSLQTP